MTAQVVPFAYKDSLVRTIQLENGDPGFYATDVAKILEHSNVAMMVQGLDDDEKGISKVYTHGGMQEILILTEPGLYVILIRSNKPQAKPFRRWVTHEVIPQIRKTGGYGRKREKQLSEIDARIKAGKLFQNTISEGMKAGLSRQDAVLRACSVTLEQTGFDLSDAIPDNFKSSPVSAAEKTELKELLESWYAVYGDKKVTVKEVLAGINRQERELSDAEKNLRRVLSAVCGDKKNNAWVIGRFISKHKGFTADSLYFEQAGLSRRRSLWRVSGKI